MNEFDLTVRRNALLMWFLAVLGVPFVIFGVDILFERRIATSLTDLIYPTTAVTAPSFETHDLAWAWTFLVVGGAMTVWALKELIAPRRVVHADARGIALAVTGPFVSPVRVPWSDVRDIGVGVGTDDGGSFPVLRLVLDDTGSLPDEPWGARWSGEGVLNLAAGEWDVDPQAVADRLLELATMHREPSPPPAVRGAVGSVWMDEAQAEIDGPWVRPDPEDTAEIPEIATDVAEDTGEAPVQQEFDLDEPAIDERPDDSDDAEAQQEEHPGDEGVDQTPPDEEPLEEDVS